MTMVCEFVAACRSCAFVVGRVCLYQTRGRLRGAFDQEIDHESLFHLSVIRPVLTFLIFFCFEDNTCVYLRLRYCIVGTGDEQLEPLNTPVNECVLLDFCVPLEFRLGATQGVYARGASGANGPI